MKKNVIALAVLAAMAAPLAAQADVTVYGIGHVSVDKLDNDELSAQQAAAATAVKAVLTGTKVGGEDKAYKVVSRASRIGVKASEDLGGGLKAVVGMEWQVDMADETGGDKNFKARNQYVGLAGGFGTVVVGRHDTPMKMSTGKLDFFGDEAGDYNTIAGFVDHRANNAIAYISPNLNGLTIAGAIVPGENADNNGDGDVNDGLTAATSIAGMYGAGPLYLALGYEAADADVTLTGEDWKATRAGVGYNVAGLDLAFVYENQDSGSDAFGDRAVMELGVKYAMGANVIKAAYASAGDWSEAEDTDHTGYAVGFDHNFSKSSKVYVQYAAIQAGDNGYAKVTNGFSSSGLSMGGDESTLSLGMKVKF